MNSHFEPMNAPNLILNRDGVDGPAETVLDDLLHARDHVFDSNHVHANADGEVIVRRSASPIPRSERVTVVDTHHSLSAARPVASPQTEVVIHNDSSPSLVSSAIAGVKGVVNSTASTVSNAIHGTTGWVRDRLSSDARSRSPSPAGNANVHADVYSAAAHRGAEGHTGAARAAAAPRDSTLVPASRATVSSASQQRIVVTDRDASRDLARELSHDVDRVKSTVSHAAHEAASAVTNVAKGVGSAVSRAATTVERDTSAHHARVVSFAQHPTLVTGHKVGPSHVVLQRTEMMDTVANATAPALGADVDASDGLAEAGAALGRGLGRWLGMSTSRSANILSTEERRTTWTSSVA